MGKRRLIQLLARFGLGETAKPAELRRAYFRLAKQTHPDTNASVASSSEQFARLTAEFEEADSLLRQALLRDGKRWAESNSGSGRSDDRDKKTQWNYCPERKQQGERNYRSGSWLWAAGGVAFSTAWFCFTVPATWWEPKLPRHAMSLGPGPVLGWSLLARSSDELVPSGELWQGRVPGNAVVARGRPPAPMSESERRQRTFVVVKPKSSERVLETTSKREPPPTLPAWVLRKSSPRRESNPVDIAVYPSTEVVSRQTGKASTASPSYHLSSGARVRAAAERGLAEWLDVLGEQGAREFNSVDSAGRSPLHCCAASGQFSACAILLKHRARVDSVDCDNRTPITVARDAGWLEIVRLLEEAAQGPSRERCRRLHETENQILLDGRR
mmetsp:Transcript_19754/g.47997  ORF Transcript_19754/g.47997 Transcript_19754/m.47997 type:complete len:386 (-) Transcript_19754:12-1169(-)